MNRFTAVVSHEKRVYWKISKSGTLCKAELQEKHQLTGSMFARILDELRKEGMIRELGLRPSSSGRRPVLYGINADYRYILGVKIPRFFSIRGLNQFHQTVHEYYKERTVNYLSHGLKLLLTSIAACRRSR